MLESIFEKVESIDQAVKGKADNTAMLQLEKRMQCLKDKKDNNVLMQKLKKDETEHSTLNRKVEEVVVMLTDKRDEWKDSVANEIVMDKIQDRLKEEEVEREEQEKRRNSVIVFGLNESCATEAEVRVADDVEKFQDIMHELEVRHESGITKVVRLGKKAESADEKPRPLKVSFSSEESKLDVLKKAKNLRDKKEGGLDKVFIYPDLTPKQREARKKLVAELKSRQSNGESGLIIVGSKIVKRRAA